MVGALSPPYTIYRVTSCLQMLALSINLQPEYELHSSNRFGHFQKFEKNRVGTLSPDTLRKKFSARGLSSCS